MKTEELQKVLKPLIKKVVKETITEMLLEEGLLSNVISECVKGISGKEIISESKKPEFSFKAGKKPLFNSDSASKRQALKEISSKAYNGVNIFENTQPLAKGGQEGDNKPTLTSGHSVLKDMDPDDPGVDISAFGIFK